MAMLSRSQMRLMGLAFILLSSFECSTRAPAGTVPRDDAEPISPRKAIAETDLKRQPHLAWNAFVDVVARTPYERLDRRQRPAHLVFWYNAEVLNGGHYQYFENPTGRRAAEAVGALRHLGLPCQARILDQALASWTAGERKAPSGTQEFVDNALAGEFDSFDAAYHKCSPSTDRALEAYVAANKELFIAVVGAAQLGVAPDGVSPRR
jgi:hypothetical protein